MFLSNQGLSFTNFLRYSINKEKAMIQAKAKKPDKAVPIKPVRKTSKKMPPDYIKVNLS
jgi:hypothetical protein